MRLMRAKRFPSEASAREPRGALWVCIEQHGHVLNLITTHLGLLPGERLQQVETLLGPDWLGHPECRRPAVLCGDFNCGPRSMIYRRLTRVLRDAHAQRGNVPQRTWFSPWPLARLDYIFVSKELGVDHFGTGDSRLARVASDHRPVFAELILPASRCDDLGVHEAALRV
jgi:endonuclease/exonuclease/phosphatase family metal-dependent hydrolase